MTSRIRYTIHTRDSEGRVVSQFNASTRWKAILYILGF